MPFEVGRLKTGTPPRIDGKSVDFSSLEEQPGDSPLPVFSYTGSIADHPEQVCCWITHTNERTHDIIRDVAAGLPIPMNGHTTSSVMHCTAHLCTPATLKAPVHDIARQLRTRSCDLLTGMPTRFLLNLKG
jgi:hypothetical protein